MSVSARPAPARRVLHFNSYDDILNDVHDLAGREVIQLGNWSLGGVCEHLAKGMNYGIDGAPFKVQWYLRLLGPILRKRFLTRPMSPGFKLPTSASPYLPSRQAAESGVAELEQAIARQQKIRERKPHVIFGNMTPEEWDQLHFRHSEMHLSFIVPA